MKTLYTKEEIKAYIIALEDTKKDIDNRLESLRKLYSIKFR